MNLESEKSSFMDFREGQKLSIDYISHVNATDIAVHAVILSDHYSVPPELRMSEKFHMKQIEFNPKANTVIIYTSILDVFS